MFGSIDFRVSPPNANITYRRADEAVAHAAENGKASRLKTGRYLIAATATGRLSRQDVVTVEPGGSQAIEWTLATAPTREPKKAPRLRPRPVSHFEDSSRLDTRRRMVDP